MIAGHFRLCSRREVTRAGRPALGVAGATEGYGSVIIHADYTHSLLGAAVITALSGMLAASVWNRRTGAVLGVVTLILNLFGY
jgi:hypothetical protein